MKLHDLRSLRSLRSEAAKHGLYVQKECGGYRLVKDDGCRTDIFPDSGICRVVPAKHIGIFLMGMDYKSKL